MWRRCAAAWVAVAAVCAGCSSGAAKGAAPPPPPASSPSAPARASARVSPRPTPTASATPFVSSADEAGAYAFVKAYFAELDRAYATGDVSRLATYRLATCSCVGFERDIRRYYDVGGRLVGAS